MNNGPEVKTSWAHQTKDDVSEEQEHWISKLITFIGDHLWWVLILILLIAALRVIGSSPGDNPADCNGNQECLNAIRNGY